MLLGYRTLLAGLILVLPNLAQPPAQAPKPATATIEASRQRLAPASRRNENVAVQQIDNNVIKEAGVRLGNSISLLPEAKVESSYYAVEAGQPAGQVVAQPAPEPQPGWHGEITESHQNSVFNTRTFFQVGPVQPAHRNSFGARLNAPLGGFGALTANISKRDIEGMVNGNVLVPLAGERTPLAADPRRREVIARFLAAYPEGLPNRPDFDPRALNINAPQRIDESSGGLRWDTPAGASNRLSFSHALTRLREDAFQLVAGQHPDTEIHSHRSRISFTRSVSADTELSLGFVFQRTRSLLLPEPNAVGPRVRMGFQIEELGPDSHFPINRAQNSFRWGGLLNRRLAGGRHSLTLGADFTRFQLNGIESSNQRGHFQFTSNFGRTAIENLLFGTPTSYEVTIGGLARGFRNSYGSVFVADRWKIHSRLQLYWGLRYSFEIAPHEVDGLTDLGYRSDRNNWSPRFSLAWQPGAGWVARASYAVSFGQIQPVTWQQARNNLPLVRYLQASNPDLLDPLRDLLSSQRTSPTTMAPDLVSPYSHQYGLTLERGLAGGLLLRAGYIGSRTYKLLNSYITNRAEPVAGIDFTTATVDLRRPDQRFYEVRTIVNAGIAYLDAAQVGLEMPLRGGFSGSVTYAFGKAIDQGPDFSSTAANRDLLVGRSQWQYESLADRKGLSLFDSTHALVFSTSYDLPHFASRHRSVGWLTDGWQISAVTMLKSGTPLTLYVGSDSPGFGNVDGGPSDRPNILDPSILGSTIAHPDIAPQILRRDRFAYLRLGERRGSLGRSTFRKAGIHNLNAAITKQWHWSGRHEWLALLRAETYNLTNTPQFDEPQRNLSSPAFGKITNTLNDGRVLQLSLRLVL